MNTLPLTPLPQKIALRNGICCLDAHTRILSDNAALPEAWYLAEHLGRAVGSVIAVNTAAPRSASNRSASSLELRIDAGLEAFGREGYRLAVSPKRVEIAAFALPGLFYGIQTLLQMLPSAFYAGTGLYTGMGTAEGECRLTCVEIEDQPRFAWRGAMLDVSRHFLPQEFVLKFIDLLALHKMNVLHLHLTDDQGWRIEIKKYPKLTEIGAVRKKTLVGRALANPADADFSPETEQFDDVVHDGFYTQAQARAIVAYAQARHITVVPEIEMPGHAQAAVAAYPFLGCTDQPVEVSPRWGIHGALYKPAEPTFEFLQDVLTEIMAVFPSPYIHVGGDEAIKSHWRNSPECQEIKRRLDLPDEEAIQSYFIGRMDEFLAQQGRVLVGWDEILEGGLSAGAVVMSWRGEDGGVTAASQGHDIVMAPHQFTYFDYYQAKDQDAEPLAFREVLTLASVYGYEPIPAGISAGEECHVLGTQCQLWSEYIPTPAQLEYMAFPRLSAFAEVAWTDPKNKDYSSFMVRLPEHLRRLDALGVNYRPLGIRV